MSKARLARPKSRSLSFEDLSPRVVFSANPFGLDSVTADEAIIDLQVKAGTDGRIGTLEAPPISLSFGTLSPGDYSFTFEIDINITISDDTGEPVPDTVVIEAVPVTELLPEAPSTSSTPEGDAPGKPALDAIPVAAEQATDIVDQPLTLPAAQVDEPTMYSSILMTPEEQLLLELVNRSRMDPMVEASRFGIDLNDGLLPGTISAEPRQPLAPNQFLIDAANTHSEDMLERDFFSHTNPSGESPSDRALASGYPAGIAENIAWGGSAGFDIDQVGHIYQRHEDLFKSADHRLNLLSDGNREVGVGVRYGEFSTAELNYNASMVTETFGNHGGQVFVTGVVFTDEVVDDVFSRLEKRLAPES